MGQVWHFAPILPGQNLVIFTNYLCETYDAPAR